MVRRHPLFDDIDGALEAVMPHDPVELVGRWMPATRRTYERQKQIGTGAGPFRDVIDYRWEGTASSAAPLAAIGFLIVEGELFWAKSGPAVSSLPVSVSLHGYAEHSAGRATFAAKMGGAQLPGVPVACGNDVIAGCTLSTSPLSTGCVELLAYADKVGLFALFMPGQCLKVGRHRLWRLRDDRASSLPSHVRAILTRRRAGTIGSGRPVP